MEIGSLAVETLLDPLVWVPAVVTVVALLSGVIARIAEAIEGFTFRRSRRAATPFS